MACQNHPVARHGAVEARLLAIAERHKQLEQMTGLCAVHPAEPMVRTAPFAPIPPDIPLPVGKAEIILRTNKSGVAGVHRYPKYWAALTYYTKPGEGKKLIRSIFPSRRMARKRPRRWPSPSAKSILSGWRI